MKKTKIQEIIDLYKSQFSIGWVDSKDWTDNDKSLESYYELNRIIDFFDQDVFFFFSQSVLSGEYTLRGDIPNVLIDLDELFRNGEIQDGETNKYKSIIINRFNDLLNEFSVVLKSYRYLLTILDNKYEFKRANYVVNAYKTKGGLSGVSKFCRFYQILLSVTQIDHLLSSNDRTVRELILSLNELEDGIKDATILQKNQKALLILKDKCLFLLKKLLVEDNKEFDFMIDFERKHYDTTTFKFTHFDNFDRHFEFYRTEVYSNESIGQELDRKSINGKLLIGQYPLLMKYYKDSKNTDIAQINNILRDFDSLYENLFDTFQKRPFDRYALRSLKNYMYNSAFSFKMKDAAYTVEELQNDVQRIIELQNITGILNFYPYRKAIGWLINHFVNNNTLEEEKLSVIESLLKKYIAKFENSIEWCKTMSFYPVQNAYRECLTGVEGFGAVFVASSYCRPVKYDRLKDELNEYKNKALYIENEIAIRKERLELKQIKKDIDNTKTKEIEILSFYTALITFLFGTIGFFAENKNNDFVHLLYSIFGLGAILLIFVSGIHLITLRKEEHFKDYFNHPRAWFCVLTILASIGLLIWLVVNVSA